jgi:hypothetical protein
MKASKFIVLLGGILGILAFFLPLVSVTRGTGADKATATVSAFQIIKGIDEIKVHVDQASTNTHTDVAVSADQMRELKENTKGGLDQIKGFVMAIFAPALLLALMGAAGIARGKFQRLGGTFAFLLGAVGLGIGALLKGASEGNSGIGMTFLLITGVLGLAGGLLALVKPDRGDSTVRATA